MKYEKLKMEMTEVKLFHAKMNKNNPMVASQQPKHPYILRDCDVCGAPDSAVQHQDNWDVGAACYGCGGHGLRVGESGVWK